MNCLLLFCLSGLYLDAGVGYVQEHGNRPPAVTLYYLPSQGQRALVGASMYDSNGAANPMGRIAFGHEWEPSTKVRLDLELRHESWLGTTKDRGQNSAWAGVRLFPWR